MTENVAFEPTRKHTRTINKQEVAATVTAGVVTIALSLVANVLIGRASSRIHDKMAPPKPAASE